MNKKLLLLALLVLIGFKSYANTPTCQEHLGSGYCQYTGKVSQIYVNTGNLILMYFENPIDENIPKAFWPGISRGFAAAVYINDNPDFANLFYSTVLAAQASDRNVTIQMRGERQGYLVADRIWLANQ